jgi:hypothetical protein
MVMFGELLKRVPRNEHPATDAPNDQLFFSNQPVYGPKTDAYDLGCFFPGELQFERDSQNVWLPGN